MFVEHGEPSPMILLLNDRLDLRQSRQPANSSQPRGLRRPSPRVIDIDPLMCQLFWQEDAFDSTRDQKKYFSKTHGSSVGEPEKDRLSPAPYRKDKRKDQLLRIR